MAVIEVEVYESVFVGLVQLLASAAPIPVPTFAGLGSDRLLHDLSWGVPALDDSGPPAPPGGQVVRVPLAVTHLSIAELRANAHATGTVSDATAWLNVTADGTLLSVALARVDIPGQPNQTFAPALVLRSDELPIEQSGGAPIVAAAILRNAADQIITVRFATSSADALGAPPQDRLGAIDGSNWLIRVSGEYLADAVRRMLKDGLGALPSGTRPEEAPRASWTDDNGWGIDASVGIEQMDACPTLFADVDLSVTLQLRVDIEPDTSHERLVFTVHARHDLSDWDSFRCWAGLGFLVANAIGTVVPGFAIGAMVISALGFGTLLSAIAAQQIGGQQLPGLKAIPTQGDDDATFQTKALSLPVAPTGSLTAAAVGADGLETWGTLVTVAADHARIITPATVGLDWTGGFDCGSQTWSPELDLPAVNVLDEAVIAGKPFSKPPVTVFSAAVEPADLWAFTRTGTEIQVHPTAAVAAGETGILFVHSSIGLRRVEIGPVPAPPAAPSEIQLAQMKLDCIQFAPTWPSGHIDWHWLVDPPPDGELPAVRQWMATIRQLSRGSSLTVRSTRRGDAATPALALAATSDGEAFFEVCTARDEELEIEYRGTGALQVRTAQRWLIPSHLLDLGSTARALSRVDADTVCALTAERIVVVDGGGRIVAELPADGMKALSATAGGVVAWGASGAALITRQYMRPLITSPVHAAARLADGRLTLSTAGGVFSVAAGGLSALAATAPPATAEAPPMLASVRAAGQVVAVHGRQLVIARPWGTRGTARRRAL